MKKIFQPHGRISGHFKGMGAATTDMVIERAREIAIINGRPPNHYSQDDLQQAKRELTGAGNGAEEQAEEEPIFGLTQWDEEPGTSGHAVGATASIDEQTVAEMLVEEGINEAEHEQMVQGARNPANQE